MCLFNVFVLFVQCEGPSKQHVFRVFDYVHFMVVDARLGIRATSTTCILPRSLGFQRCCSPEVLVRVACLYCFAAAHLGLLVVLHCDGHCVQARVS